MNILQCFVVRKFVTYRPILAFQERPIDEDIYTIGWLDDLPRFTRLRSLNLADNNLAAFPLAVCYIKTLVELNVASNKLEELPPEIGELTK